MTEPHPSAGPRSIDLVPRMKAQGYARVDVDRRRTWLEAKTGVQLTHIGAGSIATEAMRGNIENPIGTAQMPLGVAGPLIVRGAHADGTFYVPFATTEGALVRSYERGMVTLSRSGGVATRIYLDENRITPVFFFRDIQAAHDFVQYVHASFETIRAAAESTTYHGKLRRLSCQPLGRQVMVEFYYFTGDAQGMNMIVKATEHACQMMMGQCQATRFYIFSGASSEKRASPHSGPEDSQRRSLPTL